MSNKNKIKIARFESIIQSTINDAIINEINNKVIKHALVTAVKLSEDLSVAKVYLDCFERTKIQQVVLEANRIQGFFRSKVAQKMQTFKTPSIIFKVDESIDYANHIESLLKEIHDKKGE